jgi:hypothetical protein
VAKGLLRSPFDYRRVQCAGEARIHRLEVAAAVLIDQADVDRVRAFPSARLLADRFIGEATSDAASGIEVSVAVPDALTRLHAREAPQKDNLCGAFWGSLALLSAGITVVDGEPVDQDLVARESETTLDSGDPLKSLPPGVKPRTDYRLEFEVADPATSGTSAAKLRAAITRLAGDALAALPVAGPWTPSSTGELVRLASQCDPQTLLIGNVHTGYLWAASCPPAVYADYLAGKPTTAMPADWNVGHFVAMLFTMTRGDRALVGILDTYPSLGSSGQYLQPVEAVAAALDRGGSGAGGVLCVCRSHVAELLSKSLRDAGFELRDWDNGSS